MNGIDLAFIVFGLLILFNTVVYYDWRTQDQQRRMDRLRKRGLA